VAISTNVAGGLAAVATLGIIGGWAVGQNGTREAHAGWVGWSAEALRIEQIADARRTELAEREFELGRARAEPTTACPASPTPASYAGGHRPSPCSN